MKSGIFEGNDNFIFSFNMDLQHENKYFTIGQLVAWSVCHGGHGLLGLNPQLFDILTGKGNSAVNECCIPNEEVQENIRKVCIIL